jgi:C-terminal processing protease CtpA/Prc
VTVTKELSRRPIVHRKARFVEHAHSWKARLSVPLIAVLLLTVFGVLCSVMTACKSGLTTEEKLADFRYLFDMLRDNYPYLELKVRSEGYDWLAHESEFEEWVRQSRNDKEFAQAIQRMLSMLNNGHTGIMPPQIYEMFANATAEMKPWLDEAAKTDSETVSRWYGYLSNALQYPKGQGLPFRAWYCQGEYVVYWVMADFGSKGGVQPGDTVLSIDGQPVHKYVKGLRGLTRLRLDPIRDRLYLTELLPPYSKESYEVEFGRADGTVIRAKVGFGPLTGRLRLPYLPTNLGRTDNVYTTMLADGKVAYLHINRITPFDQFQEEAQSLREFFAELRDVPALVIDIRGNGGGDDRFWMLNIVRPLATKPLTKAGAGTMRNGEFVRPFAEANSDFGQTIEGLSGTGRVLEHSEIPDALTPEQLKNLPPEVLGPEFGPLWIGETTISPSGEYPYDGKVFLLVDFTVFSSAQGFTEFCKGSGWATVVGEHTGGGNDAFTPGMVTLPNTRMPIFFAAGMGLNPDFTAVEETLTAPDILVERSPEDIIKLVEAASTGRPFTEPSPNFDPALRECIRLALEAP